MGVWLLALTIGGLALAVVSMIIAGLLRKAWLAKFVFGAVGVWLAIYAVLLVSVSLMSEEKTLGLNQPKTFCGFYLDCHLHAAVTDVRKTKTFGSKTAKGDFYIVKVRISSDAKRAELGLRQPKFEVVDAEGRRFGRVYDLTVSAEDFESTALGTDFRAKIPAGGELEGEAVFDLPQEVQNPRLDISEGAGVDKFIESILIGDEDSLFHKRKYFSLNPKTAQEK